MTEVQQEYETAIEKYEEFNLVNIRGMVAEYQKIMVPEGDEDAFGVARKALTICIRTRTAIDKRRKQNGAELRDAMAMVNADGNGLIVDFRGNSIKKHTLCRKGVRNQNRKY